ncbi:hypothetical protein [Agrobacterium tumefaciens]|uniref:hypothetical protein n=1 Tax=Agrobacterium tumefaciens TaxID=358 RepID=UPI001110EDA9|nr:hypothetical protein [Agrobacterium tumefaciens]
MATDFISATARNGDVAKQGERRPIPLAYQKGAGGKVFYQLERQLPKMNFLRRIFGGVQPSYLIRSYLMGVVVFALMMSMLSVEAQTGSPVALVIFSLASTLLFPFAKLVWDELRNLALGNNILFMNAIVLFMLKLLVNLLLWACAIVIAPIGILYLWFRTRQPTAG